MTAYSAPAGAPIWFDLSTSDPARAVEFYTALFGWEAEPARPEFGGYQNLRLNGARIAGVMPYMPEGGGPANIWSAYLRTDEPDVTADAVVQAAGQVMVPPMEVGDEGTMSVYVDPAGAVIGGWKPNTHAGLVEWGVHGAPYWFENYSDNQDASIAFYETVFGARGVLVPEAPGNYTQLFFGELAYGAIMNTVGVLPEGTPSSWNIYLTVDDMDAALAKVVELGGSVLMPAEATPWGTLATIADPLGARLSLGTPPAGM